MPRVAGFQSAGGSNVDLPAPREAGGRVAEQFQPLPGCRPAVGVHGGRVLDRRRPTGTRADARSKLISRKRSGWPRVTASPTCAEGEPRGRLRAEQIRHVGRRLAAAVGTPEPRHRPGRRAVAAELHRPRRVVERLLARYPRGIGERQPVEEQVRVETRRVGVEELRGLRDDLVNVLQVDRVGDEEIDVLSQQVVLERPHRVAVVGKHGDADVGVMARHLRPHDGHGEAARPGPRWAVAASSPAAGRAAPTAVAIAASPVCAGRRSRRRRRWPWRLTDRDGAGRLGAGRPQAAHDQPGDGNVEDQRGADPGAAHEEQPHPAGMGGSTHERHRPGVDEESAGEMADCARNGPDGSTRERRRGCNAVAASGPLAGSRQLRAGKRAACGYGPAPPCRLIREAHPWRGPRLHALMRMAPSPLRSVTLVTTGPRVPLACNSR